MNFLCKSIKLANYLIENNSKLIRIDCDKKNKNYLVFIFKKDTILDNNLDKWNTK